MLLQETPRGEEMSRSAAAGLDVHEIASIRMALSTKPGVELEIKGLGPAKAAAGLWAALPDVSDRLDWALGARLEAIVGSCPKSLESAKSGMRAWLAFYRGGLGKTGDAFPPMLDDLLAWSRFFQHEGTFRNYLSYVRLGCEIVGKSLEVLQHPSVRRAKVAVAKRGLAVRRKPRFIQQNIVAAMVLYSLDVPERKDFVMICFISYVFLLRVPSECLPLAFHEAPKGGKPCTVMRLRGGSSELFFPLRQNRNDPTVQSRGCWCAQCANTCPVHVIGEYLAEFDAGAKPFAAWRPDMVLATLRNVLMTLELAEATEYVAHDLRRGHAEDIRARGGSLAEILLAGDWRSLTFLDYLNKHRLERDATMAAHVADTSEED